ncbi:sensor histidine kinase [Actinoplanes awajinensis]|uniref:histidine kinase n=1 Tax=Actinoplanes awajinensis subsp. mycoplanecinus TaxID=135947 RepID=A0A117MNC2_9ACTN|nr:HAMP domain-containing sensor histidine kinase [Actinoplanes awajinensis]KUL26922.1 histidine kinase [Actinoplanes awajinensis subsp. mycoplanecinus]
MIADRWFRSLLGSPLGRRLLAAFLFVALSSVAVLTAAALVGTAQGLTSAQQSDRRAAAARTAEAASVAYEQAGGWTGADLTAASAIADAAGARLIVQDDTGQMVWPGRGMGPGMQSMHTGAAAVVEAPVVADGQTVGSVRLAFTTTATAGRAVAWSWVLGAAAVALFTALAAAGYVTRRLTRPLQALTGAARRFAAGEPGARAATGGPGELGELATAFDTMADDVVRADQIRRSLAADVAHELRTPLAALQAGLEELRDGLREPDTARLVALHDQTLRLGRVVQDLADLSAAESAALSLHRTDTDLAEIARTALSAHQAPLDAAGLHIDTDLTVVLPVHADPDRLHQAVTNLLANAARYCHPGDRVAVRGHRSGDLAVLEIADTGPGIPADELPHVFQRLWRGQHARSVAGSGIGLAVVRELVTAHGGTVSAASPTGGGTTITIQLPLARTAWADR